MPPKKRTPKKRSREWIPASDGSERLIPSYDETMTGHHCASINKSTGVLQGLVCKVNKSKNF